ncbi:hypothetical protein [Burkholderia perseverans]|uniref:hypothetical protein n=1 Tax=Burkholderia perseverans TaxID=2615214 RepID=UPI001FEF01A7|nr:hypothetical protein [Burkholderia perseverans]
MKHRLAKLPSPRKPAVQLALSIALLASLAGCGGGAPLFTPDGRSTAQVQCPEAGPWDTCLQNARGICDGNFDTIRQSVESGTRTLLFACRVGAAH